MNGTPLYQILQKGGAFHVVLRHGGAQVSGPHASESEAYRFAQTSESDCENFFEQGNELPAWAMGDAIVVAKENTHCHLCHKPLAVGTKAYSAKGTHFCNLGCAQMSGSYRKEMSRTTHKDGSAPPTRCFTCFAP